ncbi:hypothetical protein MTR67_031192 [Solanum verrucosum]|uniref:indole-3-pyruvate monooxygenase n=1 Tax=Solanum verrucosum TaxID=315347 RepID=A0AAF0U1Z9_SOLVR|nr:hypothetical protein MTR67_031192 [Solanum verrucosum]
MPHATSSPKYLPKNEFIQYLDEYVEYFNITPKFQTFVGLVFYNHEEKKWNVKSRNVTSGEMELYDCDFLILATGENNEGYILKVNLEYHNQKKVHFLFSKGTSPVIDVGAIDKIKLGEIKLLTSLTISSLSLSKIFTILLLFCMPDYSSIFLDDGRLKNAFPNHWKEENGLYCVGFSKSGLAGISMDAITIIDDIKTIK